MTFPLISPNRSTLCRGLLVCGLLLLALALPAGAATPVHADEGDPPGADPCASCHSPETEAWLDSAHRVEMDDNTGAGGAACAACHNEYHRGHPDEGEVELLMVDSAVCQECHPATFDQWQHSFHAAENVQCIGCHQVHSQELRLTDEQLCRSCHRDAVDDPFHTAHWYGQVNCTNCHMAEMQLPGDNRLVSAGEGVRGLTATNHDFVTVSSANCLECHKDGVGADAAYSDPTLNELRSAQAEVALLGDRLSASRKVSASLEQMTLVSLGLGIAVGGLLGLLTAIVIGYLSHKEAPYEK